MQLNMDVHRFNYPPSDWLENISVVYWHGNMRHHDQSCDCVSHWTSVACVSTRYGLFCGMDSLSAFCMQDTFARAHTRPSARATTRYLVYKSALCIIELDIASVTVSSRVIQLSCVRRMSCVYLLCMQDTFARATHSA